MLHRLLTIILEVKCKRGLRSPNFASNVKIFLFHSITIHYILILSHFIPCLSISTAFNPFLSLPFHFIPLHSNTFNFISLYSISFYSIPSHFIPFIPFHYVLFNLMRGQKQKPNEFGQVKKYTDTYSVLLINYTKSTIEKEFCSGLHFFTLNLPLLFIYLSV